MPGELDALYDEATVIRLRRTDHRSPYRSPARPADSDGWRRRAVAGGLLTGLALGLREVFDPTPDEEVVHEVDVDAPPLDDRAVRFDFVDGAPRASRIIIRPWLVST